MHDVNRTLLSSVLSVSPLMGRRVLICGGGEGGTAREILRYSDIEEVLMVDLDPDIVEVSEKYLPYWGGDKTDPRYP